MPSPLEPPMRDGAVRQLTAVQVELPSTLAEVLTVLRQVRGRSYPDNVPCPTKSAVARAAEVLFAVAPLTPGGPHKVMIAPSLVGGVCLTFFTTRRDMTIAELNNYTSILALGQGWNEPQTTRTMPHAELVKHVRYLCRK